jgi:plastocyanin
MSPARLQPGGIAARRGAFLLLLGVLCAACATVIGASAASGYRARERPSRAAPSCRRHVKHRDCPAAAREGGRSHRKRSDRGRKRGSAAKPTEPARPIVGSGSQRTAGRAPWTAAPAPVIPGSTPPVSGGASPGSSSGAGPPTEAPAVPVGPAHVQVTAEDSNGYHFILSRASVPSGQVAIEFVNHGEDEHNLNVKPGEGSLEGSLPNTAPKAHPTLTLDLNPGSYTLFCSLPGHEAKGMKATLTVE